MEERKSSSSVSRNTQRIKELEKSNHRLEWELRKLVNISKQDTGNISEIINQALDVLNDISLTIEALAPVLEDHYDEKNLYIEDEPFENLCEHKKYLIEKYMSKKSFTKRIEALESAQNRIKLLLSSLPRPSQLSTSMKPQKKREFAENRSGTKGKSFIDRKTNNFVELEKLCKDKDQQISEINEQNQDLKDQIEQKEIIIKELKMENKKFKSEIEELNVLVRFSF